MLALIFIIIVGLSLYRLRFIPNKKPWLGGFLAVLLPCVIVSGLITYELGRRSCGAKFDPDLGCVSVLPDWVTAVALVLGLLTVVVSFLIIIRSYKAPKKKA